MLQHFNPSLSFPDSSLPAACAGPTLIKPDTRAAGWQQWLQVPACALQTPLGDHIYRKQRLTDHLRLWEVDGRDT